MIQDYSNRLLQKIFNSVQDLCHTLTENLPHPAFGMPGLQERLDYASREIQQLKERLHQSLRENRILQDRNTELQLSLLKYEMPDPDLTPASAPASVRMFGRDWHN